MADRTIHQAVRIAYLAILIRSGVSLPESQLLAEKFGCSIRSIQRDKHKARQVAALIVAHLETEMSADGDFWGLVSSANRG